MSVVIVGAGKMALAYFEALRSRAIDVVVIGRGEQTARAFEEKTGHRPVTGGLERWAAAGNTAENVIVAVDVEHLEDCTLAALGAGARRILVEKPGAMDVAGLRRMRDAATGAKAEISIAYNRRFYNVVRRVRAMLEEDGGAHVCHIEFGESAEKLAASSRSPEVLARTVYNHCSHVLDLAWFLAGEPSDLAAWHAGSLPWHATAVFAGAGKTASGALFTYRADWLVAGSWRIELQTSRRQIVFAPIERPVWRENPAAEFQPVEAEPEPCKAGLAGMLNAFLAGADAGALCSMDEQIRRAGFYHRIGGYDL